MANEFNLAVALTRRAVALVTGEDMGSQFGSIHGSDSRLQEPVARAALIMLESATELPWRF